MQLWSLERKIQVSQLRIMEFYEKLNGNVCISFSGGKDSTVLLDLARRIYPDIRAAFLDTGLEYPEIRNFVKSKNNITWLKPSMTFKQVLDKYGWCYPSKDVAMTIYYARKKSPWAINALQGLEKDGSKKGTFKDRYIKYAYLVDSDFTISSKCCEIIKERPLDKYYKENGLSPIIGVIAEESKRRKNSWLKTGCNAFGDTLSKSTPIAFWTEQDILKYLKKYNIPYSSIYGDIKEIDKNENLVCTGEQRTGCMFCPIGAHLDKHPNKFERMKLSHPMQYNYCMKPVEDNGLGLGDFLDYINVLH